MKGVLNYTPGKTFLHRLDPRTKLVISLMICIASFVSNQVLFLLGLLALNLCLGAVGHVFPQTMRILKGLLKA